MIIRVRSSHDAGSVRRQSGGAGYQILGPAQRATQGSFVGLSTEMHDLRQRHCPISASTDIVVTRRGSARLTQRSQFAANGSGIGSSRAAPLDTLEQFSVPSHDQPAVGETNSHSFPFGAFNNLPGLTAITPLLIVSRELGKLARDCKFSHRSHGETWHLAAYPVFAGSFLGRVIGTFPDFSVFLVGTVVWRSRCQIPPSAVGRQTISPS